MGSNLAEQEFPVGCLASLVTFLAMHGLDIEDMVVIDFFKPFAKKGATAKPLQSGALLVGRPTTGWFI